MAIEYRLMQQRRGTAAQWAANDVVLLAGEQGFVTGPGTGEARLKVGDGVTLFSALPFVLETDATARAAIVTLEGTATTLDSRVTVLEDAATGGETLADIAGLVSANTAAIALRQTILPEGTNPGDVVFWDGSAYDASAVSPAPTLGTVLFWDPVAGSYVGASGGTPGQALQINPAGRPVWSTNIATGITEAPEDGTPYGRQDASWVSVLPEVAEAPEDGMRYLRKDAAWVVQDAFPMVFAFRGVPAASEASPPVRIPYDYTLAAGSAGHGAARTAATASTVLTILKGATPGAAGTAIATATFTSGDSEPLLVTTGAVDQALLAGDYVWALAPASPDATAADLSIVALLRRD